VFSGNSNNRFTWCFETSSINIAFTTQNLDKHRRLIVFFWWFDVLGYFVVSAAVFWCTPFIYFTTVMHKFHFLLVLTFLVRSLFAMPQYYEVLFLNNVLLTPTVHCLINVIEYPFFVMSFDDVQIAYLVCVRLIWCSFLMIGHKKKCMLILFYSCWKFGNHQGLAWFVQYQILSRSFQFELSWLIRPGIKWPQKI